MKSKSTATVMATTFFSILHCNSILKHILVRRNILLTCVLAKSIKMGSAINLHYMGSKYAKVIKLHLQHVHKCFPKIFTSLYLKQSSYNTSMAFYSLLPFPKQETVGSCDGNAVCVCVISAFEPAHSFSQNFVSIL
jgi:hypothetical protein